MTRPLPTLNEGQTVYVQLMMGQSWEKGTVVKQTRHREYEVLVAGRLYRRNRRHLRAGRENHTLERGLVDIEIYFEEELEEPVRDDDEPENREQSQPEGRGIRTSSGRLSKPPDRYGTWCWSNCCYKEREM